VLRIRHPGGESHEIEARKSSTSARCARRRRDSPGSVQQHVRPHINYIAYGPRVPTILISPYARAGYVAGVDRIAEGDVGVARRTYVAHRGESCEESGAGVTSAGEGLPGHGV